MYFRRLVSEKIYEYIYIKKLFKLIIKTISHTDNMF